MQLSLGLPFSFAEYLYALIQQYIEIPYGQDVNIVSIINTVSATRYDSLILKLLFFKLL